MTALYWGLAVLFGTVGLLVIYTGVAAWVITRRYPPLGRFVEADGVRLHIIDRGEGQPIVLLHGWGATARDFLPTLMEPLAQDFRVLAIDRPGYGFSGRPNRPPADSPAAQAAIIRAGLVKLGIERPIIVGHSWGGALALAYALTYPDEIAGVVAIAPTSHPWRGDGHLYDRISQLPILGVLFRWTLVAPLGLIVAPINVREAFAPEPDLNDYAKNIGTNLVLRPGQFRANAEDLARLKDHLETQSTAYHQISVPVAIVAGRRDRVTLTRTHARALAEAVPDATLTVVPRAGHMVHHTQPDVVLAAIRELTEKTDHSEFL